MGTRILFSVLLTAVLCSAQANRPSSDTPQEIPVFDLNAIDKTIDLLPIRLWNLDEEQSGSAGQIAMGQIRRTF